MAGIDYYLRLLYSRYTGAGLSLSHFSFNHPLGSCSHCEGLGYVLQCSPESLIKDDSLSLFDGALSDNKRVSWYLDIDGQNRAILKSVAKAHGIDFSLPLNKMNKDHRRIFFFGSGDRKYDAHWEYFRGNHL